MKRTIFLIVTLLISVTSYGIAQTFQETVPPPKPKPTFAERDMEGPRMGLSYVMPGTNLEKAMKAKKMDPVMSQFGWHFEWGIVPNNGGPQLLVEFITLISGVEYSKFYPSATLAMGIRLPNGFEFGLGPNLSLTGEDAITSLVAAIGKSLDFSGIAIPINLAYVHNPNGGRFSLIFGYAIEQ